MVFRERDHPRGCGEHKSRYTPPDPILGSSPRMRGAPTGSCPRTAWSGIIPADAGSTPLPEDMVFRERDHPRGCGEHSHSVGVRRRTRGSSPRMRGAQPHQRQGRHRRRIIPADAGSTQLGNQNRTASKDHPRGCGEHQASSSRVSSVLGSSPRMRGARLSCASAWGPARILPADAGSTYPWAL